MFHSLIFLTAAEIIFNLSNYLLQMGLGRILGAADYGRVSLVLGFTTMLTILLARGISTAMSKRLSEHESDVSFVRAVRRRAASLQLYITLTVTVLFFFVAPLIADAFRDPTLTPLFRIASFMVATFVASGFYMQYFNGIKDFTAMGVLKATRGPLRLGTILVGAYFYGVSGALVGAVIAPFLLSTTGFLLDTLRHKDVAHAPLTERYPAKNLLNYAAGFMLFLFFYEFFVRLDVYIVKFFTGDDALVGVYNAALTVSLIPYYLCIALSFVLFPTISKLTAQNAHKKIATLLTTTLRVLWTFLLPIATLMAAYAPEIMQLLFGSAFEASAPLLPYLLPGTVFATIFFVLVTVFNGADRTRISATLVFCGILCSAALNSYFLPRYGVSATASIYSLVHTGLGIAALAIAYKLYAVRLPLRALVLAPLLSSFLFYATRFLPHGPWSFVLSGAFLFLLYVTLAYAAGLITKKDLPLSKKSAT